jgi:ABC-type branched-subunit amino acid transport system substrate-binding protein
MGDVCAERIVIRPPARADRNAAHFEEPLKVGMLVDYEPNEMLPDLLDPLILAFEDAMNCGRLSHAIELITKVCVSLPKKPAKNTVDAYHQLADEGALLIMGPGASDNAVVLRDYVEARKVPVLALTGTSQLQGDYCFVLANGGHGEEPALVANFLANSGYRRIAMFGEYGGSGDTEYRAWFKEQCRLQDIHIAFEHILNQRPEDGELDVLFKEVKERVQPDALVYMGTGWCIPAFNPALARIGWNPIKVANAAFMWAPNSSAWMEAMEGWTGVDQIPGVETGDVNPNAATLFDRFEKRFDRRVEQVMIPLMYDVGRVVAEGIVNASEMSPKGVRFGLERIKMFPAANGGAHTHITFGPYDHRGYKGDFLVMRKIVNQRYVGVTGLQARHRV